MKTSILLTLLISLLLFQSCEKEEEKYERLIVGQWTTYTTLASAFFSIGDSGNSKETIYTFTEDTYAIYVESENGSKGELIDGPYEYSIKGDSIYLNSVAQKIEYLDRQFIKMGGTDLSRCK